MKRPMDVESFECVVKLLMHLILNAHKEIDVLRRLVALGVPLPLSKHEEIRREVDRDYGPLKRKIDQTSSDRLLEFLRQFEGTVQ